METREHPVQFRPTRSVGCTTLAGQEKKKQTKPFFRKQQSGKQRKGRRRREKKSPLFLSRRELGLKEEQVESIAEERRGGSP